VNFGFLFVIISVVSVVFAIKFYLNFFGKIFYDKKLDGRAFVLFVMCLSLSAGSICVLFLYSDELGYESVDSRAIKK
jgi:hypothetical protein